MIVLSAATYTLELVLSAGTADVDVSYVDRTATAYPIGGTQQTAATATTQTICSAPAASTSREIDFLSVKIKTTGGVVTIQKFNSSGAVTTQLISVTLLDEEVLTYTHGSGWAALDANGNRKEVTSSVFSSLTVSGNATVGGTLGVTGATTLTGGLVLPGTAANIALGSNYISNGGTDAGFSLDASNNATFSAAISATGGITTTAGTLMAKGALGAHQTSAIVLHQADADTSRINAYSSSATVAGKFEIFQVATDGSPSYTTAWDASGNVVFPAGVTGQAGSFTTLAASGTALINTASVLSGRALQVANTGTSDTIVAQSNGSATAVPLITWNTTTSGDNYFITFNTEGSITSRGNITYNRGGGLVAYNTTSDYRAKDVSAGIFGNAAEQLSALRVYDGLMHGATVRRPMMVAHEAQAITPWAVTGEKDAVDSDGKPIYQQVSESAYVPLLIAGWQSHEAKLTAILEELTADHADLASLRKALTEKA